MAMKQIDYRDARPKMKPGDVIAFSGKGNFSGFIKVATFSEVSHVGVILQAAVVEEQTGGTFNRIIESTALRGFNGVNVSRFSERLAEHDGEVWWLPLRVDIRANEEQHKTFFEFLFRQAEERKQFDLPQAVKSALDVFDKLPFGLHGPGYNKEDFAKFFCSELVAAGLEAAKVVDTLNASEVTPIDLCRWNIYQDDYFILKGNPEKSISRYNSRDPADWNV